MNKREFILAGGAAGVTVTSPVWAVAGTSRPVDAWQADVGRQFDVKGPHGTSQLRLDRVDLHGADARLSQFTLVFTLAGATLPAGLHQLSTEGRAPAALYLDAAGGALMRADCAGLA